MTEEQTTPPKKRRQITQKPQADGLARLPAKTRTGYEKTANRPYLLESSVVRDRYAADHAHATAEMDKIDGEILLIETTANNDCNQIRARADAETQARLARRHDLEAIAKAAYAALDAFDAPPAATPDNAQEPQ